MRGPQDGSRTSPALSVRRCLTRPSEDTAVSTPRPLRMVASRICRPLGAKLGDSSRSLSVSTSDRSGLLYGIARVLARHHVNLQLAKISTLGERVEDTFLVDGAALQHNREQLQIESELLDAIAPQAATAPATAAVSLR